jgi:CubicO group peptidase (beta-lactamase class C family)
LKRREFLLAGSQAAIGATLIPLAACSRASEKPAEAKSDPSWERLIAELDKLIPEQMEKRTVPGLSIAIIKDAKIAWRRAYGIKDADSKAPVDDDTVFQAASMSKPVFAYAVMKLCEKGVMNLDTPLTKTPPNPI